MATRRQLRYTEDPEYKQSRAALRELYGSRRIDGSAPQSAQDMTPSGRLKRAMDEGYSEPTAATMVEEQFGANFGRNRRASLASPTAGTGAASAFAASTPTGFAPAAPTALLTTVGGSPAMMPPTRMGRPSGWSATPTPSSAFPAAAPASFTPATPGPALTPLSYNLSDPSPVGATQLASLLPQTPLNSYVPPWRQQRQGGYMSSILNGASKYLI